MTKRFPATELVHDLCERGKVDIARCDQLWPMVSEHSRRGGPRMPVGSEGGGHPEGVHSDPTADAVLAAMERPVEPEVVMRRAMLQVLDALHRLDMARKAMEAQVPAMAAALSQGRKATDGRTMAEVVAIAEHRRATHDDLNCVVCHEPASPRPSGMDVACYAAWNRAGRPDRGEWGPKRRAWLEEQKRIRDQNAQLEQEWDTARHFTIGPADGMDRRAA